MFVNDSKGTNPDSTIKAIESYDRQIVLIAGGKDKGSSFDDLLDISKNKVKALVLMGETAPIIEKCARKKGFEHIYIVNDMKEAVQTSYDIAIEDGCCSSFTSLCKLGYV